MLQARLETGGKAAPFWIAGPCVLEERDTTKTIARTLCEISQRHAIPIVFKASFDKANRTSGESFRGFGLEAGLRELDWVKREFQLPTLTDIHDVSQVAQVADTVDILQIPAFLCRQTDLLKAAAQSGRPLNIKKGQFVAPENARAIVEKLEQFGAQEFWLTERGVCFGYQRLVVDFTALPVLERSGAHLILDITHSVQIMGGLGGASSGIREAIPYLARAGAASGFHGFFAETHPDPAKALSDGPNAWPLAQLEDLILTTHRIARVAHGL